MSESSELDHFFTTSNRELLSTVNRLDQLIGNSHWLSVGTYKETLLKKSLRRILPQKYSIDSGFVIAADKEGKIIRSNQTDILIWDSTNYAPLFRDDDFVIIPPEACKIMIEVKGGLTKSGLEKSLSNFDSMIDFCFVPLLRQFNIKKYIFSYELRNTKFPVGLFKTISSSYSKSAKITLTERMNCMKQWHWPTEYNPWPLLAIDGIFILSHGFILRRDRQFKDEIRFIFNAFSVKSENESLVYSIFESEILTSLGNFSNGKQGLWYMDQAGLLSLRSSIKAKPSKPKCLMIFPKVPSDEIYEDINAETVFDKY